MATELSETPAGNVVGSPTPNWLRFRASLSDTAEGESGNLVRKSLGHACDWFLLSPPHATIRSAPMERRAATSPTRCHIVQHRTTGTRERIAMCLRARSGAVSIGIFTAERYRYPSIAMAARDERRR